MNDILAHFSASVSIGGILQYAKSQFAVFN